MRVNDSLGVPEHYERPTRPVLDRPWLLYGKLPVRQAALPLQRTQIRSPAHALSNFVLHMRQARILRLWSPGTSAPSLVISKHMGMTTLVCK